MMSIAEKIKAGREKLAYSQSQLAEKANVSLRTVQRIEGGKSIPRGYTLTVLSCFP
jgi:transcriptional regulator with XRE-family HTH domain